MRTYELAIVAVPVVARALAAAAVGSGGRAPAGPLALPHAGDEQASRVEGGA